MAPPAPAAADTLDDAAATLAPEPPRRPFPVDSVIVFPRDHRGRIVDAMEPQRALHLHGSEFLEFQPGVFVYSFRTGGWPEGWSVGGRDPIHGGLLRDGRPFHSLTTGRALVEMLPTGLSDPLRFGRGIAGRADVLISNTQTFDEPRPITGLRYQSDDNGLQHTEVYHAQRRVATLFGREMLLNLSAGYQGRGSTGEYPGSVLRRERGLLARARFARPGWSLAISNLHSRHRVGAHAGVQPQPPTFYPSIFVRPGAVVRNANARRQTIRNELDVTWRASLFDDPFTATGYWTAESFRYYSFEEELPSRVHRVGMTIDQALAGGRLPLRLHAWMDGIEDGRSFAEHRSRSGIESTVSDSLRIGSAIVAARGGVLVTSSSQGGIASIEATRPVGPARIDVSVASTPLELPAMVELGWNGVIAPADVTAGRASEARARAGVVLRPFDLSLEAFTQHDRTVPLISTDADRDTLIVHSGHAALRAGATLDIGFRRVAHRGLYASGSLTTTTWLESPELQGVAPVESSHPRLHGEARLGVRALLFLGDLDADLYMRGRSWSSMRGRVLHPRSGLLVLPPADAQVFASSGLLDVVLEAGVRTATITIALENVLSGTELQYGNLIVPDYPLPERRLRLSVFWPIFD